MNNTIITLLSIIFCYASVLGQGLTQTVRGTIVDLDSQSPLIGASVYLLNSDPPIGAITDMEGNFRIDKVPIGRNSLKLSYLGYEEQIIPNIVVNSAKEVVLSLSMQEAAIKMEEIVVKAEQEKGAALNEMSLVSAQSISAEKSERYAGGFSDPSRILTSYAGVASGNDGDNDIIVRGNSPKYVQWRLEGSEITNPTHFADQNAVRGGLSAVNNNLLATSDFHTGAFSPEFGDVLSGVYDLRLRSGNNEKFEGSVGFGLLGTDLTFEGPFKKGYGGSFIINYRYSTISLISQLGLLDIDAALNFQDAVFKVVLPSKKAGVFSIFGLGGLSSFAFEDVKPDFQNTPGDNISSENVQEDYDKDSYLGNIGLNHSLPINTSSFLKTSLTYSSNGIDEDVFENKILKITDSQGATLRDSLLSRNLDYRSRLNNSTYRASMIYNNKLNAKNKVQVGVKYRLQQFKNEQSWLQESTDERYFAADFDEKIGSLQSFISWKHRLNENITIVGGLHNMNVLYNKKSTIEPRIAMNWKLNNRNNFMLGFGQHSTMESVHNYFAQVQAEDGSFYQPNKELDLLKARHYVAAYEIRFTENLRGKVEAYYQDLYNIPMENNDSSFYSTINEGNDFRYTDLVNEGKGQNYGIELTLERFYANNFYFLINGTLFDSKYTGPDGIERSTLYNGNYLINALVGKEFVNLGKKKNKSLAINAKLFYGGGKPIIPVLKDEQGNATVDVENNKFWDYDKAYQEKLDDVYTIIISATYKINKKKAAHEIYLNLDNVSSTQAKLSEYYDPNEENGVAYVSQFGFFPNLMYRLYF